MSVRVIGWSTGVFHQAVALSKRFARKSSKARVASPEGSPVAPSTSAGRKARRWDRVAASNAAKSFVHIPAFQHKAVSANHISPRRLHRRCTRRARGLHLRQNDRAEN